MLGFITKAQRIHLIPYPSIHYVGLFITFFQRTASVRQQHINKGRANVYTYMCARSSIYLSSEASHYWKLGRLRRRFMEALIYTSAVLSAGTSH